MKETEKLFRGKDMCIILQTGTNSQEKQLDLNDQ